METADESAALLALPADENPVAMTPVIYGFLPRAPIRQAVLVEDLDPKRGQTLQVNGLLLTREKAESFAVVRVTVTAF